MSQLHNFFQGSLFVSESYLDALIPLYFQSVTSNQVKTSKTVLELENTSISIIAQESTDANKIENANKVAVINFIGPVVKYSDWWIDMLGTQDYMRIMDRYKNDPMYAGVVLNVDTGGGQKYGTPEFYDYINDFKTVKPVVIFTNGLLCSGGYYFSAPASFIIANKRADAVGSIGIYTEVFDWNGYYESMGLKVHTIYSDLSEEKNKSHRDVLSGADKNYRNYITKELNPDGQKFIDDVKAVRPQIKEEVFKGGVWNGEEAVAMGLVDSNGTIQDAIDKVYELANPNNTSGNENKSNSKINNNSNLKKKSMAKNTKKFSVIQAILGVEGDGFGTVSTLSGKSGIQITEAQLETLENALVERDAKVAKVEGQVTKIRASVNEAVTTAGLVVEGKPTTSAKITMLGAEVVKRGKKPGASASKAIAEGDAFEEDETDQDKSTNLMNSL